MITKTYDETLATLREVVAEAGEGFVYQDYYGDMCYYSVDGKPACLVGRVLAKWGVDLTPMDSASAGMSTLVGLFAAPLLNRLEEEGVLEVDGLSASLLGEVQALQDNEERWGDALRGALAYIAKYYDRV